MMTASDDVCKVLNYSFSLHVQLPLAKKLADVVTSLRDSLCS